MYFKHNLDSYNGHHLYLNTRKLWIIMLSEWLMSCDTLLYLLTIH